MASKVTTAVTAYSYIRFSDEHQKLGDSLRRQLEGARAYAAREGWTLDDSLRDLGVSAFRGKHKREGNSLHRFLSLCAAGTVKKGSWLIVEAMDRLSREQVPVALKSFLAILEQGIGIITLQDGHRYTQESVAANPYELMMSIALMAGSNEYSSKLAMRVNGARQKMLNLAKDGKATPWGKRPYWLTYEDKSFKLHPEKSNLVRKMIDMVLSGQGCHSVAVELGRMQAATARGKTFWRDSTVRYLLSSPALYGAYAGNVEKNRNIRHTTIEGFYPPLIDKATFDRLQTALAARKLSRRIRTGEMVNIFGQVFTSGQDSSAMLVTKHHNQHGTLYYTLRSTASLHGGSKASGFNYDAVERAFIQFVNEIELNKDKENNILPSLKSRLSDREKRHTALSEMLISGDIAELGTIATAVKKIECEIRELRQEIGEREARQQDNSNPQDVVSLAERLDKAENKGTIRQEIKAAVSRLVKEGQMYVYANTVRRVCIVRAVLRDGEARLFAVRTGFKQEPLAATDIVVGYGQHMLFDFDAMGSYLLEADDRAFLAFAPSKFHSGIKFSSVKEPAAELAKATA